MTKPLHIAFLCPRFLWAGGGSIIYTRHLALEMEKRGHQITLVADESDELSADVLTVPRDRSIERRADKKLSLENKRGRYRLAKWLYRNGKQQLLQAGPYCPTLADPSFYDEFDVVVLMNSGSTSWTVLVAEAIAKTSDEKPFYAFPFFHPHEGVAEYSILSSLHAGYQAVCTLTDFEKDFMTKKEWNQQITTMGAGSYTYSAPVSEDSFRNDHQIPSDAPIVLFMGRKIYNKGITHVVEAMDEVWDSFPDAYLALLGYSHNSEAWLDGYLEKSRHQKLNQVVNLSDVNEQTHEEAMAACQVLIAPSISDSFGMVFLDGWRYSKPVIACRNTCCETYITHEQEGLLVGFGEVTEIGDAIIRLLNNAEEAARMGQAGHQLWLSDFQWPQVAERFEELLHAG